MALLYSVCSMGLLTCIIAWLSLEFSTILPSILAFVLGLLTLLAAFVAVLMTGFAQLSRVFGWLFLIMTVLIIMASVGLVVPFGLQYGTAGSTDMIGAICDDCEQQGMKTVECVELCQDECCFTDWSAPLSLGFIVLSGLAFFTGLAGIPAGLAHLCYAYKIDRGK